MNRKQLLTVTALMVAVALVAPAAEARRGETIFELADVRGDDHGNGTLVYPLNQNFSRGDLDIVSFAAKRVPGGTLFEAQFAKPIRVPQRETIDSIGTQVTDVARLGFYNLNLDIYIDKDRVRGSGGTQMLPGRQAAIDASHAWDQAVIVTPCPHQVRDALQRNMRNQVAERAREAGDETGTLEAEYRSRVPGEVDRRIFFPSRVRVRGTRMSVFVPDEFLGGPARDDWSYVVAVSGADLAQSTHVAARLGFGEATESLMVLPVGIGRSTTFFGGREEGQRYYPALVDILVPASVEQEKLLRSFDSSAERVATVVGVVPSEQL